MKKFLLFSLALLLLPQAAGAAVFQSDDVVNTEADLASDFYAAGNEVVVDQAVAGDIMVAGSTINVKANISDDIFVAGSKITIEETSAQDVFVAGESVVLGGNFSGDVFVAAASLEISDNTQIAGNLRYAGPAEAAFGEGTNVVGEYKLYTAEKPEISMQDIIMSWLRAVLGLFVTALVLHYLFPILSERILQNLTNKILPSFGLGFVWFLLMLPVFVLLLFTLVGWHLAFAVLLFSALGFILAWPWATVFVGALAMEKIFKQKSKISWQHILLGAVLMQVALLVPIVGFLMVTFVVAAAAGSLLLVLWQAAR